MADQIQLPVLLSLLPKVGKLIQAEQDRPSMQQALAGELMRDLFRQEREQVVELKKTQEALHVRPDDERDRRGREEQSRREREALRDEEDTSEHNDPWSGQIINIKV